MKLDEFKAWFEGFTEDMERAPTAKQWKRIKERVAEIDGVAISYPVYIDRYWPHARPFYSANPIWNGAILCGATSQSVGVSDNVSYTAAANQMASPSFDMQAGDGGAVFDAASAMFAAGKAEAASFNA